MAVPSFRDRIPVIVDRVTTLCGPGELVDAVVTERGIAINPNRKDLLRAVHDKGLPLRTLEEIRREVLALCGGAPDAPRVDPSHPVAIVKWVDGTVLDTVYKVVDA
jgi:citrate lyase subunit alpha/citrate CoA-transferase